MNLLKNSTEVIPYTINKELCSDCYIAFDAGEIVVNAPWYFSRKQIQTMINEKRQWILEKLREYQEQNSTYISKGYISLLGTYYPVHLCYKFIKTPNIHLVNNNIEVILPNKYKKIDSTHIFKILVEKLYYKLAIQELETAMEKTRLMLGFAPEDFEIKELKPHQLSSFIFEEKKLIFSPEIVKYDRATIEYIVLHEFCHLKYKTHAKGFWKMINKYIPNYKKYEALIQSI